MKNPQPPQTKESQLLAREQLATMSYEEREALIKRLEKEVISRLLASSEWVYFVEN